MPFLRDVSLKRKLMVIIMLTSSVALLLACAAFVTYERVEFRQDMVDDLTVKAELFAGQSTAALSFKDPKAATEILRKLVAQKHIVSGCIYGSDGHVFAQYQRADVHGDFSPPAPRKDGHWFDDHYLELFREILLNDKAIGTVYLKSDLLELNMRLLQYANIVIYVLLISIGVAWLLSLRLQRIVSQPILHLAKTTRAVSARKNYSLRAVKQGNDELGELIDGFNDMLAQIQARDAELGQGRKYLEQRRLIHALDTAALQRPRRIFAIGQEVAERLRRFNGLNAHVMRHPTSMEGLREGNFGYFLLPGRLHRWNRAQLAIEAMRFVAAPVELIIAGTGEDEAEFRRAASADSRMHFVGRVSDERLADLYANALAVLFTPRSEDLGLVTLEAFQSAKPVITCIDSGGNSSHQRVEVRVRHDQGRKKGNPDKGKPFSLHGKHRGNSVKHFQKQVTFQAEY